MNTKTKIVTAFLVAAYVISPVDLMPGVPVDDVIIAIIYALSNLKSLPPKTTS